MMMMMMLLIAVLCFVVACGLLGTTYMKLEHLSDRLHCLGDLDEEPGKQQEDLEELEWSPEIIELLLELFHRGEEMSREIQSLERRREQLEAKRKTFEEGLEMCRNNASRNAWVWNDDATYEKTMTLPQRMNEESLDERMFEEELQLKEEFDLERQVEETEQLTERRGNGGMQLGSLFLHWLREDRGIVLARELEEKWYGKKHSMEKETESAVDCGYELSPELIGAQGLKEGLFTQTGDLSRRNEGFEHASIEKEVEVDNLEVREGRFEAPLQDSSNLPDRSRGPETKDTPDLQKEVQNLERRVQSLQDLVAHQEEILGEQKEKIESFEKMIVELEGENKCLHHNVAARDEAIASLEWKDAILWEEVQALRNRVAELEEANAELRGKWLLLFIFALPLACFVLLRKWLLCGGDELAEEGDELTRIN